MTAQQAFLQQEKWVLIYVHTFKSPFFSGETLESSSLFPDPIHNDKPFDIAQKRTQSPIAIFKILTLES